MAKIQQPNQKIESRVEEKAVPGAKISKKRRFSEEKFAEIKRRKAEKKKATSHLVETILINYASIRREIVEAVRASQSTLVNLLKYDHLMMRWQCPPVLLYKRLLVLANIVFKNHKSGRIPELVAVGDASKVDLRRILRNIDPIKDLFPDMECNTALAVFPGYHFFNCSSRSCRQKMNTKTVFEVTWLVEERCKDILSLGETEVKNRLQYVATKIPASGWEHEGFNLYLSSDPQLAMRGCWKTMEEIIRSIESVLVGRHEKERPDQWSKRLLSKLEWPQDLVSMCSQLTWEDEAYGQELQDKQEAGPEQAAEDQERVQVEPMQLEDQRVQGVGETGAEKEAAGDNADRTTPEQGASAVPTFMPTALVLPVRRNKKRAVSRQPQPQQPQLQDETIELIDSFIQDFTGER